MQIPVLTYQVIFQEGVVGKLSLTPPFNECQVQVHCDQLIQEFRCNITYEDEEYGKDKGIYYEYEKEGEPEIDSLDFSIVASASSTNPFSKGDGKYRVGLYVKNKDGIWNEYYIFITTELGGVHKNLKTSTNEQFNVQ